MKVLSVDLAYKAFRDIGIALLSVQPGRREASYELLRPFSVTTADAPQPDVVADELVRLCEAKGSKFIIVDGPQGWKGADNGLVHSRICERELNTQGKTGLPGTSKPANMMPFFSFSIALFDALNLRGWARFDKEFWRPGLSTVAESYPNSAWKALGLRHLPSKRKANAADIERCLSALEVAGLVEAGSIKPTHDELQAIVAGLGGLQLLRGTPDACSIVGRKPFASEGTWREGFIVNPKAPANSSRAS